MSAEALTVPLDREQLRRSVGEPERITDWLEAAPLNSAPASWPGETAPRPALRAVPITRPRRRGLKPMVGALTAVGVILVILMSQLGLSIAVSEGAYEARALQLELRDLTRVERVLAQNAEKLASPQNLAQNAVELGMVQNTTPATLRLSDGKVLGSLKSKTTAAATNLVPNSALEGLPMVDANGLLIDRDPEQAAAAKATATLAPVTWEGLLPAPKTR